MNVIDALKRLERNGSECGKATAKLRASAILIADQIIKACPYRTQRDLPRGYSIGTVRGFQGRRETYLYPPRGEGALNGEGGYACGDFSAPQPDGCALDSLHAFARDIATGLLDEIAAQWEAERVQHETDATTLAAARPDELDEEGLSQ